MILDVLRTSTTFRMTHQGNFAKKYAMVFSQKVSTIYFYDMLIPFSKVEKRKD